MLLLGAAQHRVNESRVMANAASPRLGVPCALLGCHLAPQGWLRPCDRHHCHLPWLGPVHASPDAAGHGGMRVSLALGCLEGGCLLPRDVSFPGTSSQGHLPEDDSFPGMSPSQGHLLPKDICFLGICPSWGPHIPKDVSFSGTSPSWGPCLLSRDVSFLGTSSHMPALGQGLSKHGAVTPASDVGSASQHGGGAGGAPLPACSPHPQPAFACHPSRSHPTHAPAIPSGLPASLM